MMISKKADKYGAKKAIEVSATRGTRDNSTVLKNGLVASIAEKDAEAKKKPMVGCSIGITKSMGNYESLRIDVWSSDFVEERETKEQVFNRLRAELGEQLTLIVREYTED